MSHTDEPATERPALRVVSGAPTPDELAVLTAVLTAATGGDTEPVRGVRQRLSGGWNDPAHQHRQTPSPGPNAWRGSYLPR